MFPAVGAPIRRPLFRKTFPSEGKVAWPIPREAMTDEVSKQPSERR